MFLADLPMVPEGALPSPILPSFHRPELLRYTLKKYQVQSGNPGATLADMPDLTRRIMVRPFKGANDHPNFTGSNIAFDPLNGPWDIDNDGDGIPDSIWIDPGFPVQT